MTIFIDRSNVNGADDYSVAPVTHLYLKVSEGTTFVDSTYLTRRHLALQAGAVVGGYHFAGHNDPAAEADFFLSKLLDADKGRGALRPCLDLESGQSRQWAEAFVSKVKKRLGYYPVLYGSTSFIAPMRAASATLRKCPWWRAEFGVNDGARHALSGGEMGAAAHQYTSTATVPGISGNTDQSVFLAAKLMMVPSTERARWEVRLDGEVKAHTRHPVLWEAAHPRRFRRHTKIVFEREKS